MTTSTTHTGLLLMSCLLLLRVRPLDYLLARVAQVTDTLARDVVSLCEPREQGNPSTSASTEVMSLEPNCIRQDFPVNAARKRSCSTRPTRSALWRLGL